MDIRDYSERTFEEIKHFTDEEIEFWYARELALVLEYKRWDKFKNVIEKAKEACYNSGFSVEDHFSHVGNMVELGSGANQEIRVLSCTKYDGLVDSIEYFGRKMYSDDISNYKVVKKGEICYATNHIEEGSIGIMNKYDIGLVSPMYTVFSVDKSCDSNFVFQVLKSDRYVELYKSLMSASVNRRGSLRWNEFSKIKIYCPPYEEQVAISDFVNLINKEINLHQQELEALKLQKKGLMQLLLTGIVRVNN